MGEMGGNSDLSSVRDAISEVDRIVFKIDLEVKTQNVKRVSIRPALLPVVISVVAASPTPSSGPPYPVLGVASSGVEGREHAFIG